MHSCCNLAKAFLLDLYVSASSLLLPLCVLDVSNQFIENFDWPPFILVDGSLIQTFREYLRLYFSHIFNDSLISISYHLNTETVRISLFYHYFHVGLLPFKGSGNHGCIHPAILSGLALEVLVLECNLRLRCKKARCHYSLQTSCRVRSRGTSSR